MYQANIRWVIGLIVAILVLVIAMLVLFLAILPAIVRSQAKKISVTTTALEISHPTSTSFQISGHQELSKVPLSPTIDGFKALLRDASGSSLFEVQIPTFRGQQLEIAAQNVTILNETAYALYATQVITDDSVYLYASGKTKVHVSVAKKATYK